MEFKDALAALKKGEMVCRNNWQGLFVFMQVPSIIDIDIVQRMQSLPTQVKLQFLKRNIDFISYNNQLVIVNDINSISGWSPSVEDLMATDWKLC